MTADIDAPLAILTAAPDMRRRLIGDLRRIAGRAAWTASHVGAPGCAVRAQARDEALALTVAIALIERYAP